MDTARDPVLTLCLLKTHRDGTGKYLPGGVGALLADQFRATWDRHGAELNPFQSRQTCESKE